MSKDLVLAKSDIQFRPSFVSANCASTSVPNGPLASTKKMAPNGEVEFESGGAFKMVWKLELSFGR